MTPNVPSNFRHTKSQRLHALAGEQYNDIRQVIAEAVRSAYQEPSYEMEEPEVEAYEGPEPDIQFPDLNAIPHHSPYQSGFEDANTMSFKDGDRVMWTEKYHKSPFPLVTYHGTVVKAPGIYARKAGKIPRSTSQMGSMVRIVVDTIEVKGKVKRLSSPEAKIRQAKYLKHDLNPPSADGIKPIKSLV